MGLGAGGGVRRRRVRRVDVRGARMKKWLKEIAGELFPVIFPLLFMGGGWWLSLSATGYAAKLYVDVYFLERRVEEAEARAAAAEARAAAAEAWAATVEEEAGMWVAEAGR